MKKVRNPVQKYACTDADTGMSPCPTAEAFRFL